MKFKLCWTSKEAWTRWFGIQFLNNCVLEIENECKFAQPLTNTLHMINYETWGFIVIVCSKQQSVSFGASGKRCACGSCCWIPSLQRFSGLGPSRFTVGFVWGMLQLAHNLGGWGREETMTAHHPQEMPTFFDVLGAFWQEQAVSQGSLLSQSATTVI